MCLILFVFLMCYVEIRVLVFLILLGWSVLIVASHIIRGIWSMGYSPIPFCPVRELKSLTIVPLFKGLEFLLTVFEVVVWYSSPLGGLEWGFRVG